MNELIVMTGAAGGIGSHLVRELSRRNYRIIATDYDLAALKDVAEQQGMALRCDLRGFRCSGRESLV